MPGQRRSAGPRAQGSWLPRLAGLGVVLALAAAGVTAYLLAFHPGSRHHGGALPTKVISYQTVGLVSEAAQPGAAPGQLTQLVGTADGAQFAVLGQAQVQQGAPQWTADQMAGGTYIFIYLKNGDCLAATGPSGNPKVELERCNLQAQQRWRQTGAGTVSQGHDFHEYANLADGSCLTQTGPQAGQAFGAALTNCASSDNASQLIAFWWSSL